jgi:hypothetical protein
VDLNVIFSHAYLVFSLINTRTTLQVCGLNTGYYMNETTKKYPTYVEGKGLTRYSQRVSSLCYALNIT